MNNAIVPLTLSFNDILALGPLLWLTFGALMLLLVTTFSNNNDSKLAAPITLATIAIAFIANAFAPASSNPLLTSWLQFDQLARFFTYFFLVIGFASTLLAMPFFQLRENSGWKLPHCEYFFLLLIALLGLMLISSAADFLILFIGLETLSIALYIACNYLKRQSYSQEAAIKYFLIGSLAAAFLLYGIALLYGAMGSTNFGDFHKVYATLATPTAKALFFAGIAGVTIGIAFKIAVVPLHSWAPDVYSGAPTPVTAFMSVGTKVGAFAALVRLFMVPIPEVSEIWGQAIALLAYPTLIYANFVAMQQTQLRRFFAYSGIAHSGFLLIPLAVNTPEATNALLFYLVVYAFATMGCFVILALFDQKPEGATLKDLRGLFRQSPFLASLFALCLLTLAGIPPTVGFFAKFFVFKLAFQAGYYGLVGVGLLTTILSAFYYLRMVAIMAQPLPLDTKKPLTSWPALVVGGGAFAALVLLTLFPEPIFDLLA